MEVGISLERALAVIRAHVTLQDTERVSALDALGRVLAEDVIAPMDQPPFPRSPLDGYAFAAASVAGANREHPVCLAVVDTVYAGGWREEPVPAGCAVRIMTGAPIPAGCDCVIRQEDTADGDGTVAVPFELKPWENYCFRGEDYREGQVLIPAGSVLNAATLGVLGSAGLYREDVTLAVRKTPKIALLCTGDELVEGDGSPLPKGKIYSSNAPLLAARLRELGVEVTACHSSFGDDPQEVADALKKLCEEADGIITTGGVSVGARDIFHEALPLLGAQRLFWRVLLKPGTPLMFSLYEGKPILSLSGNPFAAAATFELLARPMLAAMTGNERLDPMTVTAVLETPFPKGGKVRRFVRGIMKDGAVTLPEGHSSGQLRSCVGTNCLVELEGGRGPVETGERVAVHLL